MHALMDSLEAPWKIAKERKKSAMKMATSEITTADVVDSPTPFAPPWVVIPQEQLTLDMIAPKTTDLSIRAKMSDFWRALEAESKITFGPTSYTKSGSRERIAGERQTGLERRRDGGAVLPARRTDAEIPIAKHRMASSGSAIAHAMTLGVTR